MFSFKKNIILLFITIFVISYIQPIFAINTTSFVWSDISAPTLQTVASINQDKR